MDLARLKLETALDHQLAERSLPLMADDLNATVYSSVLQQMYGFIRGWEIWADSIKDPHFAALITNRRRSPLLATDLAHFSSALPANRYAGPKIDKSALPAVLGAMYVIEGSTLGGQYIARHVERVLKLRPGAGDAYFRGYGELTGSMWSEFRAVVEQISNDDSDMLIEAAKLVFRDFSAWMSASNELSEGKSP